MQNQLPIPGTACVVCGSREVRIDAVEQAGWLLLAECPRCEHRFTQPLREAPRARLRVAGAALRAQVANAA
jgi:transcription elongation factor Elf1